MKHIVYILILLLLIIIFGIMIKRHHYAEQPNSCLNVRKTGNTLPQCTIFGGYLKQQCNKSTGECWCVTPEGQEIAGTKTQNGLQPEACPMGWFDRFYQQLQ